MSSSYTGNLFIMQVNFLKIQRFQDSKDKIVKTTKNWLLKCFLRSWSQYCVLLLLSAIPFLKFYSASLFRTKTCLVSFLIFKPSIHHIYLSRFLGYGKKLTLIRSGM